MLKRHAVATSAGIVALGLLAATWGAMPSAQAPPGRGTANGEWRHLGGDAGSTRYSPLDQVTPANFETLQEAWRFSPQDVVGPMTARATPSYVGGKLLSVAGPRRHVVSIDPTNGKLLWNFVEPETYRSKYSMRAAVRKGRGVPRDRRPRAWCTSPRRASSCSRWTRKPAGRSRTGAGRFSSRRFRRAASWTSPRI